MADRQDDDWANHQGGYKRPPPWGQFRKGRSGNPNGRPKGTGKKVMNKKAALKLTGSEEILDKLIEEQVELSKGGTRVKLKKHEALRHAQFSLAIKGNPLAMRDIHRDIVHLEARKEAIKRAATEAAEQDAREKAKQDEACFQHLLKVKERQSRAWARAAGEGKHEPHEPWPHPDDILVDQVSRTARVRGPLSSDEAPRWQLSRRRRDHFLARMVLATICEEPGSDVLAAAWLVCLIEEDRHLPTRWQIAQDMKLEIDRLSAMRLPRLRELVSNGAAEFERGMSLQPWPAEIYKRQNKMWAPLIKKLGFRSLKQLDRFCDRASAWD